MIGVVIGYTSLTVMGCEVTLAKDKYVPRQECGKQTTVDRPDTGTQDKEGESNDFFSCVFTYLSSFHFVSFTATKAIWKQCDILVCENGDFYLF